MASLLHTRQYSPATPPQQVLKEVFGYDEFRPLQEDIISSVLAGRDTVAIMPTGGGKSLCYQIPALMLEGVTLVVSPLIALMQDQVAGLQAAGVNAVFLNSILDREEYFVAVNMIHSGEVKLVYMSPEGLARTDRLLQLFSHHRLACLTIDEAHCISQWGHDFRPDYRNIAQVRELFPDSVCLALTATATESVRKDIVSSLQMRQPASFLASFDRPNIFLEVVAKKSPMMQVKKCLEAHKGESGIIYCFSRKQVEELAQELKDSGFDVLPYHAGLDDEVRSHHQQLFIRDKVLIMVATVAFGMGINKPNVRFVIHYDLPRSLEQYYQEIGRAGRDGELSHALLLYSAADIRKIRYFIEEKSDQERDAAERLLQEMIRYATTRRCRRQLLLSYFGEDAGSGPSGSVRTAAEQCCDICAFAPPEDRDVTIPFQKLLSCIVRTNQRFGATYIIDVLLGSKQKRIVDNGHHNLSTWGIGRELDRDSWYELAECLVEYGYLKKSLDYNVLSITPLGRETLSQRQVVKLPVNFGQAGTSSRTGSRDGSRAGLSFGIDFDDSVTSPVSPTKKTPVFGPAALQVDKKKADAKKLRVSDDDAMGQELYQRLKDLRRRLADDEDVPPYIIFGDVTLTALAVQKRAAIRRCWKSTASVR